MDKKSITVITFLAALVAVALPIGWAVYLSNRQALDAERTRAMGYARDVSNRNDIISDQTVNGIRRLVAANAKEPCSAESIERMRQINLASSRVQAFGFVADDRLLCSSATSAGSPDGGLYIGKSDFKLHYPSTYRSDVEFPFAKGIKFMVVEFGGYAALLDRSLLIDWKIAEKDASIAAFSVESGQAFSSRGLIRPGWIARDEGLKETTFLDRGYVVAVARSSKYRTGTVVALPLSYVMERTKSFAMVLAPVAAVAGIVLAFAVVYLARMQLGLPAVIRSALRRKEFFLVYQPIVELTTGRWVGAEALIRWRRRNHEMVGPDVFIPAAEQAGLMQRITERVLELVVQDAGGLFELHPDFYLSVNLCPADLHRARTVELLEQMARTLKAGPNNLMVEATERGLVNAEEGMEVIRAIRAAGIRVAIDDFGTGYSSLSYLESFELDFLKIDRSFVKSVATEAATSYVAEHIIGMAKALKLELIAEGVENETQARYLRGHGVRMAQGYLFAKPMSFGELAAGLTMVDVVGEARSFASANEAHFSDDETVAKMGHPNSRRAER